jgi:LacI family transcriptional regulator
MAGAGLPVLPQWYAMGPTTPDRVRAALATMLSGPEPVTALFAGNNRVTVTAVRVLSDHPRPVALVGFDDFELADLLSPPVTVVAQDAPGLGRTAAQLLFRRLDGLTTEAPTRTELPARLIARGSGEIPPSS